MLSTRAPWALALAGIVAVALVELLTPATPIGMPRCPEYGSSLTIDTSRPRDVERERAYVVHCHRHSIRFPLPPECIDYAAVPCLDE